MSLFGTIDNKASISAVNDYFLKTAAKNPAAETLKQQFFKWYTGLNAVTNRLDSSYMEASNRRNAFNIANAESPAELAKVKEVIQTGFSTSSARPELANKKDSQGNFPNAPGRTVASAGRGAVMSGARATIKQGATGDAVKEWQKILGVTADGKFGPQTTAKTKEWQKARGLKADGIVGSASWTAALGGKPMSDESALVTPVAPDNAKPSQVPVGTVIAKPAIEVPHTSKPKPVASTTAPKPQASNAPRPQTARPPTPAKPKEPVNTAATEKPAVAEAGMLPDWWNKLPSWGKATLTVGTVVSLVAAARAKVR
jgi:peptidoglycan hydrolase-like protein with peptidoglycan-binding domain